MSEPLTLHEAAERLGVHYMTAYRYVRHGLLAAEKVGGSWQVEQSAVDRLMVERAAPATRDADGSAARVPWDERFEARLVAGDGMGAWGVVESALSAGADLDSVYLDVVSPAMVSIGQRWADGEFDIAVEHVASGIVTRIIGRLGHRFARPGRARGEIVLGSPVGEEHALPGAMLSDLMRLRGWDVFDLGVNVPPTSFVHAASRDEVVAVGISITSPTHLPAAADACSALRTALPHVMVIAGGRAVTGMDHAEELGAHGWAASGAEMHSLIDGWSSNAGASTSG